MDGRGVSTHPIVLRRLTTITVVLSYLLNGMILQVLPSRHPGTLQNGISKIMGDFATRFSSGFSFSTHLVISIHSILRGVVFEKNMIYLIMVQKCMKTRVVRTSNLIL